MKFDLSRQKVQLTQGFFRLGGALTMSIANTKNPDAITAPGQIGLAVLSDQEKFIRSKLEY